jgi:hypothetical protein
MNAPLLFSTVWAFLVAALSLGLAPLHGSPDGGGGGG